LKVGCKRAGKSIALDFIQSHSDSLECGFTDATARMSRVRGGSGILFCFSQKRYSGRPDPRFLAWGTPCTKFDLTPLHKAKNDG